MKILHIDSSIRNERSVSKALSRLFVDRLVEEFNEASTDYLDLSVDTPAHPTALFIRGNYATPDQRTPEMIAELEASEKLVDKMHNAGVYVIGMPMYNFSVPSNFKAFIDNVVRINRTFRLAAHGSEGMLTGKKVYVINTRGVDFTPVHMAGMDQLTPYLKTVFGFMGLDDVTFIDVHPVQFAAPEARALAIEKAENEILTIVAELAEEKKNQSMQLI